MNRHPIDIIDEVLRPLLGSLKATEIAVALWHQLFQQVSPLPCEDGDKRVSNIEIVADGKTVIAMSVNLNLPAALPAALRWAANILEEQATERGLPPQDDPADAPTTH